MSASRPPRRSRSAPEPPNLPSTASVEQPRPALVSRWVTNLIAAGIFAVWAVSMVADFLMETYAPPQAIHVAMMAVIGGCWGYGLLGKTST